MRGAERTGHPSKEPEVTTIPEITLVMPCYNGVKYIRQAVESVCSQNCRDWKLLIGDDGSDDGTAEYIQSLADERISVFLQQRTGGIFQNLNFLISKVRSPIIQLLCQDDYLTGRDSLQRILEIWTSLPPEIAFLRCNHGGDGDSALMRLEASVLPKIVPQRKSDLFFFIFGCIPGNLSNVSFRTGVVEKIGLFRTDLPYAGDFEFWSRVGRSNPWALSDARVVWIRSHSGQASFTLNKRGELLPQLNRVIQELYDRLRLQGYRSLELRLMATVSYAVRQMDYGLKRGLSGQGWGYLQQVDSVMLRSKFVLGRGGSWMVYVLSLGGRALAPCVARHLAKREMSESPA